MYTEHFRLTEPPFSIAPNPRYLFLSPKHREALAHLLYGIGVGGGFIVLTGEVGTGKTTLCRALLGQLPDDVDIALIFNPRLNSRELLAGICDELQIHYAGPKATLKQLIDALNHHLLDAHARGRRVIVLIDEAQNLRHDVLEQVRLLTNLETDQTKLLQIILVGQPELNHILGRPNLRQLAQRITARYHLDSLTGQETGDYLRHRLIVAQGDARIFSNGAVRVIHRQSGGIPRLINLIADRSLLGAYTQGQERVSGTVASQAARELLSQVGRQRPRLRRVGGWAILLLCLLLPWFLWTVTKEGSLERPPGNERSGDRVHSDEAGSSEAGRASPDASQPTDALRQGPLSLPEATATSNEGDAAFVDWLRSSGSSQSEPLQALLALWTGTAASTEVAPCDQAETLELRCDSVRGSWQRLRQLNLPAVLEFVEDDGQPRYALLTGVRDEQVMLGVGEKQVTFALHAILTRWTGQATLMWRWSGGVLKPIGPGMESPLVGWVRERLAVAPPLSGKADLYDESLRVSILEYQRSHGLRPDGIIGLITLISLESTSRDSTLPRLESPQQ